MNKTITSITQTSIHHPAIGRLFSIVFSDGSKEFYYEETFYHQFDDYHTHHDINSLVGREIDSSKPVFDEFVSEQQDSFYNLN